MPIRRLLSRPNFAPEDMGIGNSRNGELTQIYVLRYLITRAPGRTAVQLATAIYGEISARQRIATSLDTLVARGEICRRGAGVRLDPYRYYPARSDHGG